MRLFDAREVRRIRLTELAWQSLIRAEPSANADALAVKARRLAEAFLKVEEAVLEKEANNKG